MTFAGDAPEPSDLAFGPCALCGRETRDSPYWQGIGPAATQFTFGVNKAFCSAVCSILYAVQEDDADSAGS